MAIIAVERAVECDDTPTATTWPYLVLRTIAQLPPSARSRWSVPLFLATWPLMRLMYVYKANRQTSEWSQQDISAIILSVGVVGARVSLKAPKRVRRSGDYVRPALTGGTAPGVHSHY